MMMTKTMKMKECNVSMDCALGLGEKSKIKIKTCTLELSWENEFKPNLFSSLFGFEHTFCCKNAILFFCTFYTGKVPKIGQKINKIEMWPKLGQKMIY